MDLDAFTAVHRDEWERLKALNARRRLSGAEADELLRLYQSASAHLSLIRSVAPEGALSASLSTVLAQTRTKFTGARSSPLEDLAGFFTSSLPAAFYRLRWLTVIVAAAFLAIALAYGIWAGGNPAVLRAMGDDEQWRQIADSGFVAYYSDNPAASFAGQVWTNNAWIAAQCVAFGVTGIWGPFAIYSNAQNVGIMGGMMFSHDRGDVFFSYILPHGLMELTAVFIAGAAGLRIFWAWVSPGPKRRLAALASEGRSLITVALGLVLVLLVSGLVEAFVTPSDLPVWLKIGIGAVVLGSYWAYTLIWGRRAFRAGQRGDLVESDAGAVLPAR